MYWFICIEHVLTSCFIVFKCIFLQFFDIVYFLTDTKCFLFFHSANSIFLITIFFSWIELVGAILIEVIWGGFCWKRGAWDVEGSELSCIWFYAISLSLTHTFIHFLISFSQNFVIAWAEKRKLQLFSPNPAGQGK